MYYYVRDRLTVGVITIYRLSDVKLKLDTDFSSLEGIVSRELGIAKKHIKNCHLAKKSVDARKKNDVHFICTIDFEYDAPIKSIPRLSKIDPLPYYPPTTSKNPQRHIAVVGSGPAGLFCALTLLNSGINVTLLERGEAVEQRQKDIETLHSKNKLNPESNIQFGEGGAGTFSDGKLNTGIKNPRCKYVLERLSKFCNAPEIVYDAKPHIGTDRLVTGVKNIRKEIMRLGGKIHFSHRLVDLDIHNNELKGVTALNNHEEKYFPCDGVVLAIGHSARDTFEMLCKKGLEMCQKPFAVGVRIEHPQSVINAAQYGNFANHPALPTADYKLSCHLPDGRGVYSFCMCPGGSVVAAASEENMLCTNGMSNSKRDGQNANSALLVSVNPSDFGNEHPLAGVEFQRKIERDAFYSGGNKDRYSAPVQLVGDFLKKRSSIQTGSVKPTYLPDIKLVALEEYLPFFVTDSLRSAIPEFAKKIRNFDMADALLVGPETRSSSPVRILRNDLFESNVKGIYPCGEGAGYAGGITSAAVDGIKVAEAIINN